ncbi:hypothetical protein RvY_12560 [Ramazzottius varieornatus]|uniref:Uncharacterized protein n=1 Tax=Ramazzottius varieornatus TaxID=947166 RepID=A0A1D1VM71_RAMVA|nr:hypothetical protein RvY_12560 [Ramazzottius varieornatus]
MAIDGGYNYGKLRGRHMTLSPCVPTQKNKLWGARSTIIPLQPSCAAVSGQPARPPSHHSLHLTANPSHLAGRQLWSGRRRLTSMSLSVAQYRVIPISWNDFGRE